MARDPQGRLAAGRRLAANVIVGPAQAFIQTEASSGIVLLVATLAALAWANWWDASYHDFWHAELGLDLNLFRVDLDLRHAVGDGLMTIFFFVVGLEIKRELLRGELASVRKASLPVAAALGGMAVPAVIYTFFNAGSEGSRGWGIPMATDIAFALGLLAILGRRVPFSLRVFVLALAIVDDLGAIAVIAVFYTDTVSWEAVAWAAVVIGLIVAANRGGVRSVDLYVVLGVLLWVAVFKSGVHATIAGVVLAALTPSKPHFGRGFGSAVARLIGRFRRNGGGRRQDAGRDSRGASRDNVAPLDQLEEMLHPWVSYLVVPVFALANAGVALSSQGIRDAASSEVTLGVVFGLVLGKPAGIFLMGWLACLLGLARLPQNSGYGHLMGAGILCGIGFTVSIFIAGLAFDAEQPVTDAKLGILAASTVAGIIGFAWLWIAPGEPPARPAGVGNEV